MPRRKILVKLLPRDPALPALAAAHDIPDDGR